MNKKAFSIAEAMITLLIVSLAMAAMAPMMSKKIQSGASSPQGVATVTKQETSGSWVYRIWSNGFKECWGNTNANWNNGVPLPVTFNDTTYKAIIGQSRSSNLHPILFSKTNNRVYIIYTQGGGKNTEYTNDAVTIYAAGY